MTDAKKPDLGRFGLFGGGVTPDEAKAKIREELIRERALVKARRQAADFAGLITNDPPRLEDLESRHVGRNEKCRDRSFV